MEYEVIQKHFSKHIWQKLFIKDVYLLSMNGLVTLPSHTADWEFQFGKITQFI